MTSVAILIPSCGQLGLVNLARDAIARFTTDVQHDVFLLDHAPWSEIGNEANFKALFILREAVMVPAYSHVFVMHDDALPLRLGWLAFLLSKKMPAAAMVSHRSGRGHSSGTLFESGMFAAMDLAPKMPEYDVAESIALGWGAPMLAWRLSAVMALGPMRNPSWMDAFDCDVSFDEAGQPFYTHLGGGTIGADSLWAGSPAHRKRIETWIRAAREALGLGGPWVEG
jgi:hypothetical protein